MNDNINDRINERILNKKNLEKKPNRNLKSYRNTIMLLFVLFLIVIMMGNIISKDKDFSAVENRALKKAPNFTLKEFMNGNYFKDFNSYLEDQFIGRDMFIKLKARNEKLTLRQENNDVYINDGEYLIDKFKVNSPELTKEKADVINTFVKRNLDKNISIMLVPNKVEILKDKLPFKAPEPSQTDYLKDFYSKLTVDLHKINLIPIFMDNRDKYLFFRTDHHWTQNAAFLGYTEYMRQNSLEAQPLSNFNVKKVDNNFIGTLGSKAMYIPSLKDDLDVYLPKEVDNIIVNLPEEKKKFTSLYQSDKLSDKDKYLVYLGGNYPTVRINTSSKNDKRLLIIKDSYANCFVPFLTKEFNEITLVDLRYFSGDVNKLMEDYSITDVLILYNINTFNEDQSILNINESHEDVSNKNNIEGTKNKSNTQ